MSETKDDIAAQRDALLAENERLRGQLATAGVRPANVPAGRPPFLTEGERQELLMRGATNDPFGGGLMTLTTARERFDSDLDDATQEAEDAAVRLDVEAAERPAIRGVTHVYPSVAPGVLDPAAAGQPGISGPAATDQA
jgi:hypothetical protein